MRNNAQQAQPVDLVALNGQIRNQIMSLGRSRMVTVYRRKFTDPVGQVIDIEPQKVGLLSRLTVNVKAKISGTSTAIQTLQPYGASNFFSNVKFVDYSNNTRINTSGMHLNMLASAKRARPYGAAFTSDTGQGIGNNADVMKAPATINAAATDFNFFTSVDVPIARARGDWRGMIFANVTSSSAKLSLTINPKMFGINTDTDTVDALYKSANGDKGTLDEVEISIVQHGYDQLPVSEGGAPLLPFLDTGVMYELNGTSFSDIAANSRYEIGYANNRSFLSTLLKFNNGGTLNQGSDIDEFEFETANNYTWRKHDAIMQALVHRERFSGDLPAGLYYFDTSDEPIRTDQQGNVTLNVTPNSVASNSKFDVYFESIGELAAVNQATAIGA